MNNVCCICHKKVDYKPIRLYKAEYGAGRFNAYYQIQHWNFCNNCYMKFNKWLIKHNK